MGGDSVELYEVGFKAGLDRDGDPCCIPRPGIGGWGEADRDPGAELGLDLGSRKSGELREARGCLGNEPTEVKDPSRARLEPLEEWGENGNAWSTPDAELMPCDEGVTEIAGDRTGVVAAPAEPVLAETALPPTRCGPSADDGEPVALCGPVLVFTFSVTMNVPKRDSIVR